MSTVENKTSTPSRQNNTPRRTRTTSSSNKPGSTKKTSSPRQNANVKRQNPAEKSAISKEARDPNASKPGQTPDFKKSFGNGPAKGVTSLGSVQGGVISKDNERSALEDGARAAQQTRVISGQTNQHILRNPNLGQGIRGVGGLGGVGSGILAGKNFSNALDSNRSAGDRALNGVQGIANTAHGIHGVSQGADFFRKRAGLPTLNNAPKGPPVPLSQVPSHLAQSARDIKANGLTNTLKDGLKGLTTINKPAEGLEKAGGLTRFASRAVQFAGKAAPFLGGATQVASGVSDLVQGKFNGESAATTLSGGAKLVGAGLVASGVGAPIGAALIAGSTAYDLGKLAWDNRGAIADFAKGAGSAALSGLSTAGRTALSAIPGGSALLGGIGRLFG